MISDTDIKFLLTGGSSNSSVANSLGGIPSSVEIVDNTIDNLFDNISENEALKGQTDYRCIYIKNTSGSDSFYNANIYISKQTTDGAEVTIGVAYQQAIQKIEIFGSPSFSTFNLTYTGAAITTVSVTFSATPAILAANIKAKLLEIPELAIGGVFVSEDTSTGIGVEVVFLGNYGFRKQNAFTLSGLGAATYAVTHISTGSPINANPEVIPTDKDFPKISFNNYIKTSPITIGTMLPGDGVAIWIRRMTFENTLPVAFDGLTITVDGSPIPETDEAMVPAYYSPETIVIHS